MLTHYEFFYSELYSNDVIQAFTSASQARIKDYLALNVDEEIQKTEDEVNDMKSTVLTSQNQKQALEVELKQVIQKFYDDLAGIEADAIHRKEECIKAFEETQT